MTNGEKLQSIFPNIIKYGNILIDDSGALQKNILFDDSWWNAEYKEPTTKNDLEIVIDAMEYRTNALIENIKTEIMHFANMHCSGDDVNIYDVFKVIDDCCEVDNPTTKNNLVVDCVDRRKVTCYTCRFCKMYSHGGIYCALREKGGKCIGFDSWESQEDVLDKIRAEIEQNAYPIVHGCNNHELGMTLYGILQVIDKYKAESEGT